jgi:gliding motility-associated-like protein
MKKCFTFIFLLYTICLFAQPVNDDCLGIIDLGVAPFCPGNVFFTNLDATATDIGNDNIPTPGACGDNDITFVGNDVWFQFTSSDTIMDYMITVTGITDGMGSTAMTNPQILLYRGDCSFDNLALLACGSSNNGESVLELDVLGLDPSEVYFIRINDWSPFPSPNWGSFLLCIDEIDPINTIDQDGSNACTGELYDTGGPDGDYSSNENNSFSICPPFGENVCVTFTLSYYNIEYNNEQLVFYDGPDTNSPQISNVTGYNSNTTANTGGVCYTVQASSGCLTVQFTSDGTTTFEGFAGAWECSSTPCVPIEGISIDNSITDQDIIDNISTPQTSITIDTIICASGAYGTFVATDNSDLGLKKGLLLTSGSALNALGPNTQGNTAGFNDGLAATDADLNYLSQQTGGFDAQDACVVEVDVFIGTDELVFEYIFGSEEYPEWVNFTFNDIFALLISGPGIAGDPNINNQENIAVIPGTTTPVEINNLNDITNWEYYRNNIGGQSVEYDGLTSDYLGIKKSLTARKSVMPCNTYHLKFAIADRGDNNYDSGVFIAEIKGGGPDLAFNSAIGVDYLVEECTGVNDVIIVNLSNPLPDAAFYDVTVSGTATRDIDYILNIPDIVNIPPGLTELAFPIIPLTDNIPEGTETIIITLSHDYGCGSIVVAEITVNISDAPIVNIFTGQDTAFICSGECLIMEVDGAVDYFWEPVSIVNDPFAADPETCPATSQFLAVTGSIGTLVGCIDKDSIWLEVVDPQIDIVALGSLDLCEGSSVQLQALNNVGNTNLQWSPSAGLDADDQELVTATPAAGNTTYTATVSLTGCSASDDITVNVDAFDFPTLTTIDTICQGQSVQLANNIPITTTTYQWTPDQDLSPSNNVSGPIATPSVSTTYSLLANSASGFCQQTGSVDITVIPAEVTIMPEDTVYICKGGIDTLTATSTTGMVEWTPSIGLSDTTSLTVTVDIDESSWYYASMTVGVCTVTDSVYVRVDSIPDLPILAIPGDAPYCPGEIITLISAPDLSDYPDITHLWMPAIGATSDLEELNLIITTVETITYIRRTENNACFQEDEITIDVVDAGDIQLAWSDTTICQGEPLSNEVFNATDPEWSPGTALSCTECFNPSITALDTIQYTVEVNVMGCPVSGTIQVNVMPNAIGDVISDTELCFGSDTTLNLVVDFSPGAVYTWTADPPDPTLISNAAQPNVTPLETTTYSVTVSSDICGPYEAEVTIVVIDNPVITFDQDITICEGEEITLNANSTEAGGMFTWNGPNIDNVLGTSITVSPAETASYTVTYSDGCDNDTTSTIPVSVVENITLTIESDPDTSVYQQGAIIELTAVPSGTVVGGTYLWSSDETGQVIDYTLLEVPMDTVSVVLTSPEGCQYKAEAIYNVIEPAFDTPNAFTPNGDNTSDYFNVLHGANVEIIEFKIFARWGEMIYNNETPTTGWDGKNKDKDMPSDVYFYFVRGRNPAGVILERKGDVTLIR